MRHRGRIYEPVLQAEVELHLCRDLGVYCATVDTEVQDNGIPLYVVSLTNRRDFYSLLHECVHLVRRIFEDRGIPFGTENHELIAYYQEWWFRALWRACNAKRGKGKR